MQKFLRPLVLIFCISFTAQAQIPPVHYDAVSILQSIKKLDVLGSALYIAAHPDDENTAMLAYLANGRLVRTGYLALTRGEGGQNLIGSETGEALGILRTQELLAARRIDGAEQFFGGAVDFGYSKSADETLHKWNKEAVLGKMVSIIRSFRPDVIITRFNIDQGGHGHHLASAILAREAFTAAADPERYPEQLDTTRIWQAKRLVWNAWNPDTLNGPPIVKLDLGEFNPLIGKSYLELSAESRSMHKSQGFGVSAERGSHLNYFEHTLGVPARKDLFDDVDLTWNRISGGAAIGQMIANLERQFNPEDPTAIIPALLQIRNKISAISDTYWRNRKLGETDRLIEMCSGLWMEIRTDDYTYIKSSPVRLDMSVINRSSYPITLKSAGVQTLGFDTLLEVVLPDNHPVEIKASRLMPGKIGGDLDGRFTFSIGGSTITYSVPVRYYWIDSVKGKQVRPVKVLPPLTLENNGSVLFFGQDKIRSTGMTVKSWQDSLKTMVKLTAPPGWKIEPSEIRVTIADKYGENYFPFTVTPPAEASKGKLQFSASAPLLRSQTIDYDHIPAQIYLSGSDIDLVRASIKIIPEKIGYIMGFGDEIPFDLQQLGYTVHELSDDELEQDDLQKYDVIIAGTRAFNIRAKLHLLHEKFNHYMQNGGTFIVLHNTRYGLKAENIGPYPITVKHDRVSVEDAPVTFLKPNHRLLNYPNHITSADFDGWVQERGLYFASSWDPHYETIISCHDPGEDPKDGGILYTRYGKGNYIYAAYAWFRQLPAGVSGAYRLFVNLLSVGAGE